MKEYPDLLKQVKSSDVEIRPGIYVRIKRGFIEETWQLLITCPRMVWMCVVKLFQDLIMVRMMKLGRRQGYKTENQAITSII